MQKEYTLNTLFLQKIFRENVYYLIGIILVSPMLLNSKEVNGKGGADIGLLVIIVLASLFLMNIPAIIVAVNYYLENRDTSLWIDEEAGLIFIKKGTLSNTYELSEIEKSVYHLGIYYKNYEDQALREKMLSSDLAYWDVSFQNGDRYYLTNLLIDFLHKEPIVPHTTYNYRFLQTISKPDLEALAFSQRKFDTRVVLFVKRFKNKSDEELMDIKNNTTLFCKEAVEAAKLLLKEDEEA